MDRPSYFSSVFDSHRTSFASMTTNFPMPR